jgi:aminoglycoside N3'-acetyltransferase
MVTQQDILDCLKRLGVTEESELEVHCSLSSFGEVQDGAETVISALKKACSKGSIFMPALRLSKEIPLTEEDKRLGIQTKIKVLPENRERSAMGIVADTFRRQSDVKTGEGIFGISGWGKNADKAVTGGLDYVLHNGGMALLLGVDIYKLTAMHYVEGLIPQEINNIFAPSEEVNKKYPPEEWFIETGAPPVKAWYTIQNMAYEKGLIKNEKIGNCKVMYFKIWDIVGLYESELKKDPFALYGIKR